MEPKKTRELIEREFYIQDISPKVNSVVRNCVECIVNEGKLGKSDCFLNPIDKSNLPLKTYQIDRICPLELRKKKYNYLLVVVDAFSKFVWLSSIISIRKPRKDDN